MEVLYRHKINMKEVLRLKMNILWCNVCHCQLNGSAPLRQHLVSANHIKKVKLQKAILAGQASQLSCSVCNKLCTSFFSLIEHSSSHAPQYPQEKNKSLSSVLDSPVVEAINLNPLGLGDGIQLFSFQHAFLDKLPHGSEDLLDRVPTVNSPNQKVCLPSTTMNNLTLTFQRGPNGESYLMRGDKGYCFICQVELTSPQNFKEHTNGSKHTKKEREINYYSTNHAPGIANLTTLSPVTSQREITNSQLSNRGPKGEVYDFIGVGGRCFACGVDFTSSELATQHLAGHKHKKKAASETLFGNAGQVVSNIVNSGDIPSNSSSTGYTVVHNPLGATSFGQASVHVPSSVSCNGSHSGNVQTHLGQTAGNMLSGVTSSDLASLKNISLFPQTTRGPNGEVYIFKENRGFCYPCKLELTSVVHAESHLAGKKHNKKCLDGNVNSAVPMCSICDVPFSSLENAEQHFRSEKHKKATMKESKFLKKTLEDPEQTMVMKVYQPTSLVESRGIKSLASSDTKRFDGKLLGQIGSSESLIINSAPQDTISRFQTKNAGEEIQPNPSCTSNDNVSYHETDKQNLEYKNGQFNHGDNQILSAVAGIKQLEICEYSPNAASDLTAKLGTSQNNNIIYTGTMKDFPHNENLSYWMKEQSKVGSKQIEVREIDQAQQNNFQSLTDNNILPFNGNITECSSNLLTEKDQPSNNLDSSGNVAKLPLRDSEPNNKLPVQHKNEVQLQDKFPQLPDTTQPASGPGDIPAVSYQPKCTESVLLKVKEYLPLYEKDDTRDLGPAPYYFDGNSGYCHCCSVQLTSQQHANQHLFGQKHQKKANKWELEKQLQRGYAPQTRAIQPLPMVLDPQVNAIAKSGSYYFDGHRGFCHVCNIELTSFQHTQQHINGKPHRRSHERYCMSQNGSTYPLNCQVCGKFFTGQESARQHFISSKHKNRAEVLNESVQVLMVVEEGRIFIKDGQTWVFCDVCRVPLNTREQFEIHKDSPKHKKERENNRSRSSSSPPAQEAVGKAVVLDSVYEDLRTVRLNRDPLASSQEGSEKAANVDQCALSVEANNLQLSLEIHQSQHGQERQQVLDQNRHYLTYGQTPVVTAGPDQQFKMAPANSSVSSTTLVNVSLPLNNSRSFVGTELDVSSAGHLTSSTATFSRQSLPHEISNVPIHRYSNQQSLAGTSPLTSDKFSTQSYLSNISRASGSSQSYNELWQSLKSGNENGEGHMTTPVLSGGTSVSSSGGKARANRGTSGEGNNSHSHLDKDNHGIANSSGEREVKNFDISEVSYSENEIVTSNANLANMMCKPKPSGQNRSRGNGTGLSEMFLDKKEDSFDDIDYEIEDRGNFNIVEDELVKKMAGLGLDALPTEVKMPERSDKPGFPYFCQTCKKHMNTREQYESHKKGKYHIYLLSMKPAPNRQLPPIRKSCEGDIVDRIYKMIDSSLKITPRPYQAELVEKAMKGDSIIYLPTGTGKTLVAVLTMGLMLQENPTRPVLFLVDKVLLVMQQAQYIVKHFAEKQFDRHEISDTGSELVKRKLLVKPICGGLTTKTDLPTWKHDIVITTAAYCNNMLDNGLIRWEDFSLVVLDEVHHCNKGHPYHTLMSKYHCALPESSRAKVLGLTASPAGKSTVQQTYVMLKSLLTNLGGATVALVEREQEDLSGYQSTAKIRAINVLMSSKEVEFKHYLLEYFILCYSQLALMTTSLKSNEPPCSYFQKALRGNREATKELASDLIRDPEPLVEVLSVIYSAKCIDELNVECRSRFDNLRLHICNLLLVIPEIGSGTDMDELLKTLSPSVTEEFVKMGLPCEQTYQRVKKFAEDGNNDLTMFNKLVETLQDTEVINWSDKSSRALVLVRERKLARQYCHRLRLHPMVKEKLLRVGHIVGHGKGAKDGGMDVKKQRKVFDNHEKYHALVATSIMEEGIDIQALQLVVCMNPPSSLRALVQMRGRARRKGSHFVILCSSEEDVDKLKNLEKQEINMEEAAKKCLQEERSREN